MNSNDLMIFIGAAAVAYLLLRNRKTTTSFTTNVATYDGVSIGSEQARMLAAQDAGF